MAAWWWCRRSPIVTLKDYRAAASLRELFGITLGMVRVKINHFAGKPNPYRMNSPTASIAVRGTEFSIEVDAEGATQVVVFEGAVEVASLTDPDRRVLIEAGRGVLVQGGQDFHLIGAIPAQPGNRDAGDRNGPPERAKPVQQANARGAGRALRRAAAARRGRAPRRPAARLRCRTPIRQPPAARRSRSRRYAARQREHLRPLPRGPCRHRASAVSVSLQRLPRSAPGQPGEPRLRHRIPQCRRAGVHPADVPRRAHSPGIPVRVRPGRQPAQRLQHLAASFLLRAGRRLHLRRQRLGVARRQHDTDGDAGLRARHRCESQSASPAPQTSGSSSGTFYSGALVAARRFGANSFGVELASLKGTGSISSLTTETIGPGRLSEERSQSTSDISQTRLTAGFSRDLSRNVKLGLFYRYAFIRADDHDVSHTINDLPRGLNATRTAGHSSEFGVRLRGLATPRLSYGFAAAWLGISLLDGMNRIDHGGFPRTRPRATRFGGGWPGLRAHAAHHAQLRSGRRQRPHLGRPHRGLLPAPCCKTPWPTAASCPLTPPCRATLRAVCFSPPRS